jgi:hypothetical protein
MSYTGKLLKDSRNWTLDPRVVAESVGECPQNSVHLLKYLKRVYKDNPRFGRSLAKDCMASRRKALILYYFMTHWLYSWLVLNNVLTKEQLIECERETGLFRSTQQNLV